MQEEGAEGGRWFSGAVAAAVTASAAAVVAATAAATLEPQSMTDGEPPSTASTSATPSESYDGLSFVSVSTGSSVVHLF